MDDVHELPTVRDEAPPYAGVAARLRDGALRRRATLFVGGARRADRAHRLSSARTFAISSPRGTSRSLLSTRRRSLIFTTPAWCSRAPTMIASGMPARSAYLNCLPGLSAAP